MWLARTQVLLSFHTSLRNFIRSHCLRSVSWKITPTSEYPALTFPINSVLIFEKFGICTHRSPVSQIQYVPTEWSLFFQNPTHPSVFTIKKMPSTSYSSRKPAVLLKFPSPNSTPVNFTSQIYLEPSLLSPAHLSPQ